MNALAWAIRYARLGWPTLPLWWLDQDGACVCRSHGACRPGFGKHDECTETECKKCKPGKHPIGFVCRAGPLDATTDRVRIFEWFRRYPIANLGVACSRFIAIDIDPRNGGDAWMAEMVRLHGRLPVTPTARTGGNGWHFLFQHPDFDCLGRAGPGLDIKKRGGYIIAAPSRTVDEYRWLRPPETPLAVLPAWLQSLVKRPDPPPLPEAPQFPQDDVERRIRRARAYLERVEPAVQGQGGSTRTFEACQHVARGFLLDEGQAFSALSDWNARCDPPWSDRELKRKIREALTKGTMQPGRHL